MAISVDDLYQRSKQEALGPVNCYFAWEALGCSPDPLQAMSHFLEHKGGEWVERQMGVPERPIGEITGTSSAVS
jgi:hypothetical protein